MRLANQDWDLSLMEGSSCLFLSVYSVNDYNCLLMILSPVDCSIRLEKCLFVTVVFVILFGNKSK